MELNISNQSTIIRGCKDGHPKAAVSQTPSPIGDEVLIKISASGLCGTDLHYKCLDNIPLGHEGVGVVQELGSSVKQLRKGQRVGWGFQTDSCGNCTSCLKGQEVYCPGRTIYGTGQKDHQGTFATYAICRETFLHPIPDELGDEEAAALQCAGATVFQTLKDTDANEVVGVIGVGGLGHLAIQYASKMGCRVVVFSQSADKEQLARDLGATDFCGLDTEVESGGNSSLFAETINRLLITSSMLPDWKTIVPCLAPQAKVYPLSFPDGDFTFPFFPLTVSGITIHGSLVASRAVHREMLAFSALHEIRPITERFPMTERGLNDAIERLEKGRIRYKAILVPPSTGLSLNLAHL